MTNQRIMVDILLLNKIVPLKMKKTLTVTEFLIDRSM